MITEATTIKLHRSTKRALDDFKGIESYDEAIQVLLSHVKQKHLKADLIEAYKSMGKKDMELLEEWEVASQEVDEYG